MSCLTTLTACSVGGEARSAVLSEDGVYRYRLTRRWAPSAAPALREGRYRSVTLGGALMSCLTALTPPGWQGPADGVPCCSATMHGDWGDCTCWAPIYDPPEQARMLRGEVTVMPAMCADCAYRPGSPERMGDPDAAADGHDLDDLAIGGAPFWCHDGMRRVVAMRHTGTGETVELTGQHHYDPPVDGRQRPHRTDGTVGSLCAGWDARRKAWASAPADRDLPTLAHASTPWEASP